MSRSTEYAFGVSARSLAADTWPVGDGTAALIDARPIARTHSAGRANHVARDGDAGTTNCVRRQTGWPAWPSDRSARTVHATPRESRHTARHGRSSQYVVEAIRARSNGIDVQVSRHRRHHPMPSDHPLMLPCLIIEDACQ